MTITQERLKQVLYYSHETGCFTWRESSATRPQGGGPGHCYGDKAGSIAKSSGYVIIYVDSLKYYAHRLAFLYMTGEWPINGQADHRDRCRNNNKWFNLRDASPTKNKYNERMRKNNTTGYKGVSYSIRDKAYRARITENGKERGLGYFKTAEEAHEAYQIAAKQRNGEYHPT